MAPPPESPLPQFLRPPRSDAGARSLSVVDRTSPPQPDDEIDDIDDDDGSVASKILGGSGRTSGASSLSKSISSPSLLLASSHNSNNNNINSTIMSSCKESVRETPYQKILKLKKMKLHQCAEEIGSESSSSDYISYSGTDSGITSDKSSALLIATPSAAEPVIGVGGGGGGGVVAPPELTAQAAGMAADFHSTAASDSDSNQRQLPPPPAQSDNGQINRSGGMSSVKSAPNLCDLPLRPLAEAVHEPEAANHSGIDGGGRRSWAPPPPDFGGGFSWMASSNTDTSIPIDRYKRSSISIASTAPPTAAPRRRKPFPPPLAVVGLRSPSTGHGGLPPLFQAHRENGRLILRISCGSSSSTSSGAAPIEAAAAPDSILQRFGESDGDGSDGGILDAEQKNHQPDPARDQVAPAPASTHPFSVPKSGDSDVYSRQLHIAGVMAPDLSVKSDVLLGEPDPSLVRAHLPNATYGTAGNIAVSISPISNIGIVPQLKRSDVRMID